MSSSYQFQQKIHNGSINARSSHLKSADTPRTQRVKKIMKKSPYLPALDNMPSFLRYGPWSPAAYIFLICFALIMIYEFPSARDAAPDFNKSIEASFSVALWRLACAIYGVGLVT